MWWIFRFLANSFATYCEQLSLSGAPAKIRRRHFAALRRRAGCIALRLMGHVWTHACERGFLHIESKLFNNRIVSFWRIYLFFMHPDQVTFFATSSFVSAMRRIQIATKYVLSLFQNIIIYTQCVRLHYFLFIFKITSLGSWSLLQPFLIMWFKSNFKNPIYTPL